MSKTAGAGPRPSGTEQLRAGEEDDRGEAEEGRQGRQGGVEQVVAVVRFAEANLHVRLESGFRGLIRIDASCSIPEPLHTSSAD